MILLYNFQFNLSSLQSLNNQFINNINQLNLFQQNYVINELFIQNHNHTPAKLVDNVNISNSTIEYSVVINIQKINLNHIQNMDQYAYNKITNTLPNYLKPYFNFNPIEVHYIKNKTELRQDVINFRLLANLKRIEKNVLIKLQQGYHKLNKHLNPQMGQIFNKQMQLEYNMFTKLILQNNSVNSIMLANKLFQFQLFTAKQKRLILNREIQMEAIKVKE